MGESVFSQKQMVNMLSSAKRETLPNDSNVMRPRTSKTHLGSGDNPISATANCAQRADGCMDATVYGLTVINTFLKFYSFRNMLICLSPEGNFESSNPKWST